MLEKEIFNYYTTILDIRHIEYYHVNGMARKYQKRYFMDLLFTYNNKIYLREFGLKGAHTDRKAKQMEYMRKWHDQAPDITSIMIILSMEGAIEDLKGIGLLS